MRADATHRFEFEVDGGRRPPCACLARTRAEAEQVARHAGARVRLRSQVPVAREDGDAAARETLRDEGLLRDPWRHDVLEIVSGLDHARSTGDAVSVVPVAFLPRSEILARGLIACACGRHGGGELGGGLRAVEPSAALSAQMVDDGGWELHLWQRPDRPRVRALDDWQPCSNDPDALALHFLPACSVWVVAHRVLCTLMLVADLRPGELSVAPAGPGGAARA